MKRIILGFTLLFSPLITLATTPTLSSLIVSATHLLNLLIPFAIGLAIVVFLFAMVKYVTAGGGEEKSAARGLMIYGIIAIFVMVSIWGLVRFIQSSTGVGQGTAPAAPTIPTYSGGSN